MYLYFLNVLYILREIYVIFDFEIKLDISF